MTTHAERRKQLDERLESLVSAADVIFVGSERLLLEIIQTQYEILQGELNILIARLDDPGPPAS